ncbi:MAG: hypothetical protein LBU60_03450 [Clostridiales bacterium]|nr:hypothetical protein [Clostridiales bacterium]
MGRETFAYDNIGNPTRYRSNAMTWERGSLLASYRSNTYSYDGYGRRVSKRDSSRVATDYTYDVGGKLLRQVKAMICSAFCQ